MTHTSAGLIDVIAKFFWIVLFSLVPAVLLGIDFGFSIGVGYFVVAAAVLSVHYDVQDTRKAIQQMAASDRSGQPGTSRSGLPHHEGAS